MIRHARSAIVVASLALAAARPVSAQCPRCELPILQLTAGARPLGLGGAYATGDGANAVFHNPAQVGSSSGSAVTVERIGGLTFGSLATTGRLGSFGIGAGVRFLAAGTDDPAGDSATLHGGGFVVGATIARQVHGIWVGATASFFTPDLSRSGQGVLDVGAAYRHFGLLFGIAAQNLGSDFPLRDVPQLLPRRLTFGASLPAQSISTFFDLSASAAVSVERGGAVIPKAGIELTYEPVSGWTFTARGGVHRVVNFPGEFRQSAVSLGGSFGLDRVNIDYTFAPAVAGGRATHSVGLRIE